MHTYSSKQSEVDNVKISLTNINLIINKCFQQLLDSTAIVSILETYLLDTTTQLRDIIKYYPITNYENNSGKKTTEIANKYFVMHNKPFLNNNEKVAEA